jgi:hypothetical protein
MSSSWFLPELSEWEETVSFLTILNTRLWPPRRPERLIRDIE